MIKALFLVLLSVVLMAGDLKELKNLSDHTQGDGAVDLLLATTEGAITPDGIFLFIAGESRLASFRRDPATQLLTLSDYRTDSSWGHGAGVSQNGAYLYKGGTFGVIYDINHDNGGVVPRVMTPDIPGETIALSENELYLANIKGSTLRVHQIDSVAGTAQELVNTSFPGSSRDSYLVISGDAEDIYATERTSGFLGHYRFDPLTADLTLEQSFNYSSPSPFRSPRSPILSADGRHLYMAGAGALALYNRDLITGDLTLVGEVGGPGQRVVFSPDESRIYLGGFDGLTTYTRDAATGLLSELDVIAVGDVPDFNYPSTIVPSPDGLAVYVGSWHDHTLSAFSVDAGGLTWLAGYKPVDPGFEGLDNVTHVSSAPTNPRHFYNSHGGGKITLFDFVDWRGDIFNKGEAYDDPGSILGLMGVVATQVSPDGNQLYLVSQSGGSLTVTDRNNTTGKLTFSQLLENGAEVPDNMSAPNNLIIDPGGDHLYVASPADDALTIFSRAGNGQLTYVATVIDNLGGVDGLDGISAMAFSPAGDYLYLTADQDHTLTAFSRDPATGLLTWLASYHGLEGGTGLLGASSLAVHPTGKWVYATGTTEGNLFVFSRDQTTGLLEVVHYLNLGNTRNLWVSEDGLHVFSISSAIDLFQIDPFTGILSLDENLSLEADMDSVAASGNYLLMVANAEETSQLVAYKPDLTPAGAWLYHLEDNSTRTGIYRTSLNSGEEEIIWSGDAVYDPRQLVVDPVGEQLFWTDLNLDAILRADLDGANLEIFLDGLIDPRGLALDQNMLYFAELFSGTVSRIKTDGSQLEELFAVNTSGIYALAVDRSNSHVYWTDINTKSLKRTDFDGTLTETVRTSSEIIHGFHLDTENNHLYAADYLYLVRTDLDGGNPTQVSDATGCDGFVEVDTQAGTIYTGSQFIGNPIGSVTPYAGTENLFPVTYLGYGEKVLDTAYYKSTPLLGTVALGWHSGEKTCLGSNLDILDLVTYVNNYFTCP